MTTFQKAAVLFLAGVVFAASVVLSFVIGQHHPLASQQTDPVVVVDTLTLRDTILVKTPEIVEKKVIDTVLVPAVDTLRLHDTLYLALTREQVIWRDSLAEIYASGIDPAVDSVRHFATTHVVTVLERVQVKVSPKWSVGIGAGAVVAPVQGQMVLRPGVAVSIQRSILSW